jgi:hypothetical protein
MKIEEHSCKELDETHYKIYKVHNKEDLTSMWIFYNGSYSIIEYCPFCGVKLN